MNCQRNQIEQRLSRVQDSLKRITDRLDQHPDQLKTALSAPDLRPDVVRVKGFLEGRKMAGLPCDDTTLKTLQDVVGN